MFHLSRYIGCYFIRCHFIPDNLNISKQISECMQRIHFYSNKYSPTSLWHVCADHYTYNTYILINPFPCTNFQSCLPCPMTATFPQSAFEMVYISVALAHLLHPPFLVVVPGWLSTCPWYGIFWLCLQHIALPPTGFPWSSYFPSYHMDYSIESLHFIW